MAETKQAPLRDTIRPRERFIGAIVVALVLVVQWVSLGPAASLLGIGLLVAFALWAFGNWNGTPATILPVYLMGIAVQCLHFCEEYLTGFQREFPALMMFCVRLKLRFECANKPTGPCDCGGRVQP